MSQPHPGYPIAAGVLRTVLPNGITVLVKESHSAPVAAILISTRIGYFNEPDRWSGIAHLIEHMLFKGTPLRPHNDGVASAVRALGGIINAATSYDETYYYLLVPAEKLEPAIEILADAFQNPLFDPAELAKEIEVVVQESLQKRDNPNAMLVESLRALAYDRHRIRRWRIGHPETLRALSRDDLLQFYSETYRPENLTLTVVGSLEAERAMELCERNFAGMPRGVLVKEASPKEDDRSGFRFKRIIGSNRQRLFALQVPAPHVLDPDAAPLMVLGAALSDGRSSRLYARVKEHLRLVSSAWASYEGFADLGHFTMGAECLSDDPLDAERALWAEVRRVGEDGVRETELERIKTRIQMRRLFAQEDVMGVARTLTIYENLGEYTLCDAIAERLRGVTQEDILRVTSCYLGLRHAALIEYLPAQTDIAEAPSPEDREADILVPIGPAVTARSSDMDRPPVSKEACDAGTTRILTPCISSPTLDRRATKAGARAERPNAISLPNGATVYFRRRADLPIVAVTLLFRGGRRREQRPNCGITNLLLKTSVKGTRHYTADEIANRMESLGSGIGLYHAADHFGYTVKLHQGAIGSGLDLLREVLTCPTFPPEEVVREQAAIAAEVRRVHDNNFASAYDLFANCCFGDHPYGLPASGIAAAVAGLRAEDLLLWHSAHLTPANAVIGIVGDLSEDEAVYRCSELLNGLSRASPTLEVRPTYTELFRPFGEETERRDRQQTAAFAGFRGVDARNDARYALDILAEVTSGLSGRFFRAVRGEHALAYQVTAMNRTRLDGGTFLTYAATEPQNEERARELILAECRRLTDELIPTLELEAARSAIIGEHAIGTQSFGAQSAELAVTAVYDLPPDQSTRYLQRIGAVPAQEIREVAREHLNPERGYWIGAIRGLPNAEAADGTVTRGKS